MINLAQLVSPRVALLAELVHLLSVGHLTLGLSESVGGTCSCYGHFFIISSPFRHKWRVRFQKRSPLASKLLDLEPKQNSGVEHEFCWFTFLTWDFSDFRWPHKIFSCDHYGKKLNLHTIAGRSVIKVVDEESKR